MGVPDPTLEVEGTVGGFAVRFDRSYPPDGDLWVERLVPEEVALGLHPLGLETSGTLAELALVEPGTELVAGEPFGSLEAEKFVGPLLAPLDGVVTAVNHAALADPGAVQADPFGVWLVRVALAPGAWERARLVGGRDAILSLFEARVADYRLRGVLAE